MVKKNRRYLYSFSRNSRTWRTDTQTPHADVGRAYASHRAAKRDVLWHGVNNDQSENGRDRVACSKRSKWRQFDWWTSWLLWTSTVKQMCTCEASCLVKNVLECVRARIATYVHHSVSLWGQWGQSCKFLGKLQAVLHCLDRAVLSLSYLFIVWMYMWSADTIIHTRTHTCLPWSRHR